MKSYCPKETWDASDWALAIGPQLVEALVEGVTAERLKAMKYDDSGNIVKTVPLGEVPTANEDILSRLKALEERYTREDIEDELASLRYKIDELNDRLSVMNSLKSVDVKAIIREYLHEKFS